MVTATLIFGAPLIFIRLYYPGISWLFLNSVISAAAITLSVYLARRFIDRRSFTSLGLIWNIQAVKDVFAGIFISGVAMGTVFIIELLAGWLEIQGVGWQAEAASTFIPNLLFWSLNFLAIGFYEELLSRGYHLQNLEDGLNTPLALFLSSVIFGLGHINNPNSSLAATLGIALAGLFMAYAYLRTRQLWLPISLHIGWNFFEGVVFGFPVSGLETLRLVHHQVNGPTLMTGGAFGPEAGLVLLPGIALSTLLIYLYTRKSRTTKDT